MLTAVSITINAFLILGIIVLLITVDAIDKDNDEIRDKSRKAFEAIDSYRMYVISMYDNVFEGANKCTEIERLEWKFEDK